MGLFKLAIVGAGAYFVAKKVVSNENAIANIQQQQACANCGHSTAQHQQQYQPTPPGHPYQFRQSQPVMDQFHQQSRKEMAMS